MAQSPEQKKAIQAAFSDRVFPSAVETLRTQERCPEVREVSATTISVEDTRVRLRRIISLRGTFESREYRQRNLDVQTNQVLTVFLKTFRYPDPELGEKNFMVRAGQAKDKYFTLECLSFLLNPENTLENLRAREVFNTRIIVEETLQEFLLALLLGLPPTDPWRIFHGNQLLEALKKTHPKLSVKAITQVEE